MVTQHWPLGLIEADYEAECLNTDLTMGLGWPSGGEQPRMTLSPVLALVRPGSPGNSCCRSEIFIDNISHLISLSWLIIHFISKIPSIVQFQGKLRAQFKFCKSYGSLWSKKEQNSWQIQFLILSPRLFNVWESIQYSECMPESIIRTM